MTSTSPTSPVIVINFWSGGWSGGKPAYEEVLNHSTYRVSYIVDGEGFKGLTNGINQFCLVEKVIDIKDLEQLVKTFGNLVATGSVFHINRLMNGDPLAYTVAFRYTRPPVEFVKGLPLDTISLGDGALRDQLVAFVMKGADALSIKDTHFHLDISVDAVTQQLRVELVKDLPPMVDSTQVCAAYCPVSFPKGLPRVVTYQPSFGQEILSTLVDEHRRAPGAVLNGTGDDYHKIPARGGFAKVGRDLAEAEQQHAHAHAPVPRKGVLALIHQGFSFCHEVAACAQSLGVDLYVISSKFSPTAPLAALAPVLPFVHVTDEESLTAAAVREGLRQLEEAGYKPLACIATMESYRLLAAGINAGLGAPDASIAALKLAMDKRAARQVLLEAGLTAVKAETLTELSLATAKASGKDYFIKPRRGAASFGAFPLTEAVTYHQIQALQDQIRADTFVRAAFYDDYSFIIEDAIPGPEYSFEIIVVDSQVHIPATHGKTLVHTTHSVLEYQEMSPGVINPEELAQAHFLLNMIFQKLGLTQGLYHVEMRRADWGWELIEVNTRIGGGLINDSVQARLGGTSLIDLWIYTLLWNHEKFSVRERFAAAAEAFESAQVGGKAGVYTFQQYFFGEPGKKITAINNREIHPKPIMQLLDVKAGDKIPASDREHDIAMAMWTLSPEEWQRMGGGLIRDAPRLWQFVYED